jgi:hypothetical protein
MVITTAIVAFGTVFYVAVAISQWCLMKESGKQTSSQIDKIIDEARRIADTSSETARQAKVALDATIENFRLEQRAWVGEVGIHKVIFKEGQKIKAAIIVKNSGKTPAKNVHSSGNVRIISPNVDPCARKFDFKGRSASLLQPGDAPLYFVSYRFPNDVILTKDEIDSIKGGKLAAYLTDMITYDDVFGGHHFTKVCLRLNEDLSTFSSCTAHNNKSCNDAN